MLIILTSYYENRTFDLEDSLRTDGRPLDIHHQLMDQRRLRQHDQGPLMEVTQKPQPIYNRLHLAGVVGFVGLPCVCFALSFPHHAPSLVLSVVSVLFGAAFFTLDSALNSTARTWANAPTTRREVNIAKGVGCILIEFTCLACAAAAGIVY